jgi:tetratricopeptide (TPR) repeat protein
MITVVLALSFSMAASSPAERSISPAAAEALRAASEAAGNLKPAASSGNLDVRSAILYHVHRLQEEAGLWADASATAERMAAGATGGRRHMTWARSLARAGAIDKAAGIADQLKGAARDQVLVAIAAERAKTDPASARAIAAELGSRADAPAAWAGIGSARAEAGDSDGAAAAFAEAVRVAKLIPESSGFLVGRTVSRTKALEDIAARQVEAGRFDDALATVELLKTVPPLFGATPAEMTRAWAGRRADLLREAGRLDEAERALEAADDPPADAVLALAEAHGRAGHPDRAARWLAEVRRQIDAMAPETNRVQSLSALAEAQARLGLANAVRATLNEAEAAALERPADVFEPGHSLKRVVQARIAAGDLDGAARTVKVLGDRGRVTAIGQVAATWSAIGDQAAVEALLATIVDADSRTRAARPEPGSPAPPGGPESGAADRAIALATEGKVDEAIAAATKIQWLDDKARALVGVAASAPASADRIYGQMVGLASGFDARSSGRPSIAAALADAGRPGMALEVMEPVREIEVGEWALTRAGEAQARAGDFAGARATIDGRLKTRAGRVPVLCAIARALNDAGRRDEAVAALREAEAAAEGIEPDLAAVGALSTALHKAGRREEARRWADRASDAVDSTVYAYVSGSALGTVMDGRERRLEEAATIYADLGLAEKNWPLSARCDPRSAGVAACLRQAARAAAASDLASVAAHRDDPTATATGRAAILLGFAEGLIADGRGD